MSASPNRLPLAHTAAMLSQGRAAPTVVFVLLLLTLLLLGGRAGYDALMHMRTAQANVGGGVVTLDDTGSGAVDPWLSLQVRADPGARLDVAQALQELDTFAPVDVPTWNFGPRRGATWLWLPLRVTPGSDSRWTLAIEYPHLDRVDVHRVVDGQVVQTNTLGDEQPYDVDRATRTLQLQMNLPPGEQGLLMRVETTSSTIFPIFLYREHARFAHEARVQFLQGVVNGLCLCLALYCLASWLLMRDPIFLWYCAATFSFTAFMFSFTGLGTLHVWGSYPWLRHFAPGMFILIALAAAGGFLRHALDIKRMSRPLEVFVIGLSACAALTALGLVLQLVGYPTATRLASAYAIALMLVCLPAAFVRARQGDRASRYVLIGWLGYSLGAIMLVLMLQGVIPATTSVRHAAQAGAVFEMMMWMMVLGVRGDELRRQAEHARTEQERLRRLAVSDPLTGLPNRRGLRDALTRTLPAAAHRNVAVYLVDLDDFKPINDTLGHDAGDAVLIGVSRRLAGCMRGEDMVARLGGDEFVVLANGLQSEDEAERVGRKLLAALSEPLAIDGHQCRVRATIGYSVAPADSTDADALLRLADAAMYRGKERGGAVLVRTAPAPAADPLIPLAPTPG